MELKRAEALDVAAGVLPAIGAVAVVLESDRCVGIDLVSRQADAFAEGEIFAEVPGHLGSLSPRAETTVLPIRRTSYCRVAD